jgi:hypothetical protein
MSQSLSTALFLNSQYCKLRLKHALIIMADSANRTLDPFVPSSHNRVYHTLVSPIASLPKIESDGQELRENASLPGIWPERLLHVESMTSYGREQRSEGTFYNGVKEPAFSALSYKWGLHVVDQGPTLVIKGTNWDPPSIDQKYFTTAEHAKVIRRIGEHSGWAWVDVGCITQLLMEETMREIIVEPQYFKQAAQGFVWWVDFPSEIFQRLLNDVCKAEVSLRELKANSDDKLDLEILPRAFQDVLDPLARLISIPWFSSNWTLREIMLCNDVYILNREAEHIYIKDQQGKHTAATINMIAKLCAHILSWLYRLQCRLRTVESSTKTTLLRTAILPDTSDFGMPNKTPTNTAGNVTISRLASDCVRMVETHGAFFLYSCRPSDLHYWTKALLETGRLITEGFAGRSAHEESCYLWTSHSIPSNVPPTISGITTYHGWGGYHRIDCHCSMLCQCTGILKHGTDSRDNCHYLGYEKHGQEPSHETDCHCFHQNLCIPCVLGISFKVDAYNKADAHTPIGISKSKIKEITHVSVKNPYKE